MNSPTVLQLAKLAGLLALSTAACSSSSTRLSRNSMCTAAGGTYSYGACQPAGDLRTAQQMCVAHGGTYFPGGDYCEVGASGWKF